MSEVAPYDIHAYLDAELSTVPYRRRRRWSATVRLGAVVVNLQIANLRGIALFAAKGRTLAVLNGLLTICKRLHIDLFASNGLARSASFPANGRPSPERARQTAPGQNGRQHVPLRLFGAVMAVCLGISAQSGVTIQQVKEFIHSAFKQKQPDKQVAAALRTLKLSERLDERTVEELQAEGAGPQTVGALKELAARSAKLTATRLEFPGFLAFNSTSASRYSQA